MVEKTANFLFAPQSVAIIASSLYEKWYLGNLRSIKHIDKVRGDLAIQFLKIASAKGYQVIVVDGESSKTFHKEIKKIPGVIVLKRRGYKRSPARRLALRKASKLFGVRAIIITELEKVSLVADYIPIVVKPILDGDIDIVIPKREEKSFQATYPDYMYQSEIEGNGMYNEALRINGLLSSSDEDLDAFFGPRVLKNEPKIVSLFMRQYHINTMGSLFDKFLYDAEQYSNALYFPIVLALKKGARVKSVTIPFIYPETQKVNEEKGQRQLFIEKRKSQRLAILVELLHFIYYLDKKRQSEVRLVR